MFRKLVSNLPFSTALVGQVGFYVRRLRKEETTRRLGLLFTILAVIMQSFAVFSPPEQAVASSESDILKGGISSIRDILSAYDSGAQGKNDYKSFMDYVGITRDEIAHMSSAVTYICSSDHSVISFGRAHHYSAAEGELVHKVPLASGGVSTFYSVPLFRFDSVNNKVNCYDSYVGQSKKVGWFSIMRKCANLQIKSNVQRLPKSHLVSATCSSVQGYAYDERQLAQAVNVYVYFDGPPGQGKQYGPYVANQTTPASPASGSHGFKISVPKEYQVHNRPVAVWAVMQPLPGWSQPLVQFENKLSIPGNCKPVAQPITECLSSSINIIDRTHLNIEVQARADNGANVTGYTFSITDKSGKQVYTKTINSNAVSITSPNIELASVGDYNSNVVIHTTLGDRDGANCTSPIHISQITSCIFNPAISSQDSNCKACPYKQTIWIQDKNCVPLITLSKSVSNLTQNMSDANNTTANTSDRIQYTIRTTNASSAPANASIEEGLGSVVDYAQLIDDGGGTYDNQNKTLNFGTVSLAPNQTKTYTFVVQVFDRIPSTSNAANDPALFKCALTNSYGNTVNVAVRCPVIKTVEATIKQLPSTGPGENVLFATLVLMIVAYFFARTRLLRKEIQIIRKDFNVMGSS